MSKFIELSDYDASIHREILDALTREDDAVVDALLPFQTLRL